MHWSLFKKKYGQAFCEIIPHRLPLLTLQPRHAHKQNHETNAEYGPEECKKKKKRLHTVKTAVPFLWRYLQTFMETKNNNNKQTNWETAD